MTSSEICDLTLIDMAALIRERRLSAREALEAHLERIEQVNPVINAICTLDPEGARGAADAADRRTAAGEELPPLHGVPMTHKDTHDTAGMRTTMGSPIYADRVPDRDTEIVSRLRAAGVVTTGKSNVPELAAGSHTFNPLFGTTVNPYDPTRSAGGSSGGVAAAIAAGIQPAGDASDMGGSIRTPSSFCNLVGLRPSLGRIPLGASDPWAWISRKGPMARRAADVGLLLAVLEGRSEPVPATARIDRVAGGNLSGLRIGYTRDFGLDVPVERAVFDVLDGKVGQLAALGARLEQSGPDLRDADEVFATTRAFDFATTYGDLYEERGAELKDALRWNLAKGLDLTSADLRSAARARARLHRSVSDFFTTFDLLVAPAVQVQPFDATLEHPQLIEGREMTTYLDWMRAATLISATGLPAISVPVGFDVDGLPVGLQVVGPPGSDELLIAVATAFEAVDPQHQRRPDLLTPARLARAV